MKLIKRTCYAFLSVFFLVLIDQITKYIAQTQLQNGHPVILIPGVLQFQYLRNYGAAFGMFQNATTFFIILTVVLLILFTYCYSRIPNSKRYFPLLVVLTFFMAGAIGNFIDRIMHAYVIDFIYFNLIEFPIFNVADIYVSCSCVIFIFLLFFYYKEDELSFFKKKKG